MHDYSVHEALYLYFEIHVSWIRGSGPSVGTISLYSENALNLLCSYNYFGKTICMVMLSIMFSTFLVKFISPC